MNRLGLVIACALVAAGCSKSNNASTTAPSPTLTTETFSGTVAVGGSEFHSFGVSQEGAVAATLTVAPVVMGLGIGRPGDAGCTLLPGASTETAAGSSAQLTGAVTQGTYCVQVYDVGNATGPVTYTVSVTHP